MSNSIPPNVFQPGALDAFLQTPVVPQTEVADAGTITALGKNSADGNTQALAAQVQNDFDQFNQAPSAGKYQAAVTYSNDLASLADVVNATDPSYHISQKDFAAALTAALQGDGSLTSDQINSIVGNAKL